MSKERNFIMKWQLSIIALALLLLSCLEWAVAPERGDFNFKLSYGVGSKNVLNTYENTYTKDLIADSTVTVPFALSDSELQCIRTKMWEIGFFSYPDHFTTEALVKFLPNGTSIIQGSVTPHMTYIFEVTDNFIVKHLYWSDSLESQDSSAVKLRKLISMIVGIIESNPKYSQLPPVRGMYQ